MSAKEIGGMASQYTDPASGRVLSMDEAYHRPDIRFSRAEDDYARSKGYPGGRDYHEALAFHISQHGVHNPISYGEHPPEAGYDTMVVNGHHRYFAGRDEGLEQFPVRHYASRKLSRVPGWDDR